MLVEEFLKRLDRNSKVFDLEELMESDYSEEQLIMFTGLYVKQLQAKHEEELKQAVIKTFHFARNYGTGFDDGEQHYEANFKTKEL